MIGKEDKEREDFGSGGGKVIWRQGDEVAKEAGGLEQKENETPTDPATETTEEEAGGWATGIDSSWETERSEWENS